MKNGFIKVAAASPDLRVADCVFNAEKLISVAECANANGVKILVFPELSITASTCGDLFLTTPLLSGALEALKKYIRSTASSDMLSFVGLPLRKNGKVFNCAAVCQRGELLAVVPKAVLSSDETRYFAPGYEGDCGHGISVDRDLFAPFDTNLKLSCRIGDDDVTIGVAIGDEGISTNSTGADILAVLSASPEAVCKDEYRRTLIKAASAVSASGIIYATPGYGESSTDSVFSAHNIICENGNIIAESLPFAIDSASSDKDRLTVTEIDAELLAHDRSRLDSMSRENIRCVYFDFNDTVTELSRKYHTAPFIPADRRELAHRAEMILKMQSSGLRRRMEAAYAKKCIIGISGGLDSTLALLVAARACDEAGRPRNDIVGITMPGFGTTNRTRGNAEKLCDELGIEMRTIAIGDAVRVHFEDIGHDINNRNVVYENAQARERTQVLMDIANAENGIVVGTGDMSELALGWATYNGDHMSMYGVNASVPKTLVRALTKHCAELALAEGNKRLSEVLTDIIDTPVSPELLPSEGENIKQKTEDLVGPYEIHDFYLYYMLRFGFSPKKLFRIAVRAFEGIYTPEVLLKWLEVFIKRFFSQQYKRSCLPDGPSVGSVGLSPRGGLCIPSDASAALWRAEIEELKNNI